MHAWRIKQISKVVKTLDGVRVVDEMETSSQYHFLFQ